MQVVSHHAQAEAEDRWAGTFKYPIILKGGNNPSIEGCAVHWHQTAATRRVAEAGI